jgi:parvulin-like peptidyl-prolyl isomerase
MAAGPLVRLVRPALQPCRCERIDDAVFALKAGQTSSALATDNAVVVAYVKERQDIKPETFATERDALRDELSQQRRQEFFAAYMGKAKEKMKIELNQETIRTVLGS